MQLAKKSSFTEIVKKLLTIDREIQAQRLSVQNSHTNGNGNGNMILVRKPTVNGNSHYRMYSIGYGIGREKDGEREKEREIGRVGENSVERGNFHTDANVSVNGGGRVRDLGIENAWNSDNGEYNGSSRVGGKENMGRIQSIIGKNSKRSLRRERERERENGMERNHGMENRKEDPGLSRRGKGKLSVGLHASHAAAVVARLRVGHGK